MKDRVSWKTYFMNIAKEVATRSTCDRKHVGAVIVRDKKVSLGNSQLLVNHSVNKDGDYLLVVRPEKLFISSKSESNTNLFSGVVSESIFQGESQLLLLKLESETGDNQSLQMRIANGKDLRGKIPTVGDELSIGLRMQDSFLVE